jgi:small-conductance mechanosensitive channel
VAVGVSYGSPTRLVEELIQRAVREEPEILPNPEPILLFDAFGDNALQFEVHFWIVARSPMASRRVASHVRFRIDDLFRESGLVIAFPQRDVHLDSLRPIEVRLMDRDDPDLRDDGGTSDPLGRDD